MGDELAVAPPLAASERWFLAGLVGYFLFFGLTRVLISDAVELDEAEQVLLSQWWQWGYSAQPPLYTWLQAGLNAALGVHIAGLTLLREGLLFLTCVFVYLSARRLFAGHGRLHEPLAVAATLSLLLIPQIVWESQREYTHSLLVLCLAAATLWQVLRLLAARVRSEHPLAGYLLVGLLVALGCLAKYNFALFAAALALALLTIPAGRRLLWDWRTLAAGALTLLVLAPHVDWLLGHLEVGTALADRVNGAPISRDPLAGLGLAVGLVLLATLTFLTPFWLLFLGFFWREVRARLPEPRQSSGDAPLGQQQLRLIGAYLIFGLVAMVLAAWATEAEQLRERWLLPLLFIAPLWLFAFVVPPDAVDTSAPPRLLRRLRWFSGIAIGTGLLVLIVTAIRLPLGATIGDYSRLHQPIAALAAEIEARGIAGELLIAEHYHLAGAFRLHLPGRLCYGPRQDFALPPLAALAAGRSVLVLWDAERSRLPPPDLVAMLERAGLWSEAQAMDPPAPATLEAPYRYSRDRRYRLGLLTLPAMADPGPGPGPGPGPDPGPD